MKLVDIRHAIRDPISSSFSVCPDNRLSFDQKILLFLYDILEFSPIEKSFH